MKQTVMASQSGIKNNHLCGPTDLTYVSHIVMPSMGILAYIMIATQAIARKQMSIEAPSAGRMDTVYRANNTTANRFYLEPIERRTDTSHMIQNMFTQE